MPPRILLIGAGGQLGWELRRALLLCGEVIPADRAILDLTDADAIRRVIRSQRPDIIVNAAAYTKVDKAETEPNLAMKVNGIAPGVVAQEAKRSHSALIHYSTDYVFSGAGARPYFEDDEPNPINVYGATKLAGEQAIRAVDGAYLILRTSWVFSSRGENFMTTIVKLAQHRESLSVVDDQIGVPTWSRALAEATARILSRVPSRSESIVDAIGDSRGIYHVCCEDPTTWFGFAEQILKNCARVESNRSTAFSTRLIPISSDDYPMKAKRPRYAVLSPRKIADVFGVVIPSWREHLAAVLEELHANETSS
jgi:dTDP-4-dehydrorhamnose reductase